MLDFRLLSLLCALIFGSVTIQSCNSGTSTASAAGTSSSNALNLEGYITETLGNGITAATKVDGAGNILEYGLSKNGTPTGTWIYYGKQGKPIKMETYVDGVLNGATMEFSDAGQLTSMYSYKNGVLHGPYRKDYYTYPVQRGHYVEGKLDGVLEDYYEDTKIIRQKTRFKNGVLHGKTEYFDLQGALTFTNEYKDGEKVGK